ncbi:MAG: Rrf2 family transcriptional regulator [Pseudomonadota bacterium]|nr:Rrf2 family transcriptional regulator [Pseudomonadota bacterium]
MRLTTKGRYAVTAILDVALYECNGPVSVSDVAERQGLSPSYLEKLFSNLKKKGLVAGRKGPGGGYKLTESSHLITIANVIDAVNETVDATKCGGSKNCRGQGRCITHDLWAGLSNEIRNFLEGVSLSQLVAQQKNKTKITNENILKSIRR